MLAKVLSSTLIGIDAILVDVEVDLAPGLPAFATVGLPDGAVNRWRHITPVNAHPFDGWNDHARWREDLQSRPDLLRRVD